MGSGLVNPRASGVGNGQLSLTEMDLGTVPTTGRNTGESLPEPKSYVEKVGELLLEFQSKWDLASIKAARIEYDREVLGSSQAQLPF